MTPPKTRAGIRSVPIMPALRPALVEHRGERLPGGDELVFVNSVGRPLDPTTLRNAAYRARKRQRPPLDPITPHGCRHSSITSWVQAGVNIKTVQTWAGHSTIRITIDRYTYYQPADDAEAVARVASWLASSTRSGPVSAQSSRSDLHEPAQNKRANGVLKPA